MGIRAKNQLSIVHVEQYEITIFFSPNYKAKIEPLVSSIDYDQILTNYH